jgi:hypothetical protein
VSVNCGLTDLLNPTKAPKKVRGVEIPNLQVEILQKTHCKQTPGVCGRVGAVRSVWSSRCSQECVVE